MTIAQEAVANTSRYLIYTVGLPFHDPVDREELLDLLMEVKHPSIWGFVINQVFTDPSINGVKIYQLVKELSSQAVDDPMVMMDIVGKRATILLLRYYDLQNPKP
jgi:hypothetical protein